MAETGMALIELLQKHDEGDLLRTVGESIALRSRPPLPSLTWISIRSLSISLHFRLQTSDAHSPASARRQSDRPFPRR
jgi:hypothetical protein